MKTLDRYLIREILTPFLLALGLFTFLLAVKPALDYAQDWLSKGVDIPTVAWLLMWLLPQALGVTLPMAFMTGLLMGLGRLSGDRESVALLACGVSPMRLLRPVLLLALLIGGADMYTLIRLVPDSNLKFREETFRILVDQGESDIKPGLFYEGFTNKVLRVKEVLPAGGWRDVMLADTSQMSDGRPPTITLADSGYLLIDQAKQQVAIVLRGESVQYSPGGEDGAYNMTRVRDLRIAIPPRDVFGDGNLGVSPGLPEMTIAALRKEEARRIAAGLSPHPPIIQRHQMFSFPVACLVFAVIGVALGLHTRKEGKLGGLTLGVGVIFVYYGVMTMFEALTKGGLFPAAWARWVPNIVVGAMGVAAIWWRSRSSGGELALHLPAWMTPKRGRNDAESPVQASGAPAVPRRPGIVVRVPDFGRYVPRPRVLDLYVAGKYLSVTVLACVALLGLYYIGTLIDKSERLFKDQASIGMLVEYFYYSTPQFVAYVVPMAALVSALAAIGSLTRTGELIVMRACGVSLYRAAAPILVLAAVWSAGLFLLDDRVLARANRQAEVLEDQIRGNAPHTVNVIANANWLADRNDRIYYYMVFDVPRVTIYNLSIFDIGENYRLESQTRTDKAVYDDATGLWQVDAGWVQRFPAPDRVSREILPAQEMKLASPTMFSGMHNQEAELMTFTELRRHIEDQAASGVRMTASRVHLQERIAFPLVTIVMTLLGVPFGVTMGRRGALYGIGFAMILGCGYWLLNTLFVAAGQADVLPPALAAWATNLLFLALAAYAMLTVRT